MGTAVVAVVGGLGTAIMMSDIHRKQAAVAAHLKAFAATIEGAVAATSTGVRRCADVVPVVYTPRRRAITRDHAQVRYWNGIHRSSPHAPAAVTLACSGSLLRVSELTDGDDGRVDRVDGHRHPQAVPTRRTPPCS